MQKFSRVFTLAVIFISAFSSLIMADNAIDVLVTSFHQHDTIWADWPSTFDIYIETDVALGGMSLGHKFWSPDGASWQWHPVAGGWGASRFMIPILSSRWSGLTCFDMAAGIVTEQNIDGLDYDTVMTGGSGMMGCPPGPLEHMYSYSFIMTAPDENVYAMCLDSCFVPPSGAFVFVNNFGSAFYPDILWPYGGKCWPVKEYTKVCGDANGDGEFNVGDAIYTIAYIFRGGPEPPNFWLADVNNDDQVNVGDAVYMIGNIFKSGPSPICP